MRETDTQRLKELVSNTIRAVPTIARLIIDNVARPATREEGRHVLATRLTCWSSEVVQLARFADDR